MKERVLKSSKPNIPFWCKLGLHKFSSGSYKYCLRPGCHAVRFQDKKKEK